MDRQVEILLGSQRDINSVNTEEYTKTELSRKTSEITEFTVNDVVDSTEVFDGERNNNPVYRIYGRIEYMSLLNGLIDDYSELSDYFNPDFGVDCKTLKNSFNFYLVRPAEDSYFNISGTDNYVRYFKVVATPDDFELFPAGFTTNVYDEQTYGFAFNTDFDVSQYFDYFGFPITELFLYAEYIVGENGNGVEEVMKFSRFMSGGNVIKTIYNPLSLSIGDNLQTANSVKIGDVITYNKSDFTQNQIVNQKIYITTEYDKNGNSLDLDWVYDPFIPLRLRYFGDDLNTAEMPRFTENTTSLEIVNTGNTAINAVVIKNTEHLIKSNTTTITDWTSETSAGISVDLIGGDMTFGTTGTYTLTFKSEIRFPQNSYRYYGVATLQEYSGGTWVDISGATVWFESNYDKKQLMLTRSFNAGDEIRIRTRLIPNPNELVPEDTEIPEYATELNTGQYVWRDIVPQGNTEPLSGNGVDYPFINGRRYLFAPIILSVSPDLDDTNTADVFDEIDMNSNTSLLQYTPEPENDLNDIGKPCQ